MEQKLDLIIKELKTVKEEINSVRSELKEEINSVRSELKEEMNSVRSELRTVKTELQKEIDSLKTKFEIFESNQLTFLQELREQRLENQTREKILLNEISKINESIKFVNRRAADVELEVDEIKRDLKEYRKANLG